MIFLEDIWQCFTRTAHSGKESTCQWRRHKRHGFDSWIGNIPWGRKWQPTPVFLPGELHGQRSLVDYSPWGHKKSDTTEHKIGLYKNYYIRHYNSSLCFLTTLTREDKRNNQNKKNSGIQNKGMKLNQTNLFNQLVLLFFCPTKYHVYKVVMLINLSRSTSCRTFISIYWISKECLLCARCCSIYLMYGDEPNTRMELSDRH